MSKPNKVYQVFRLPGICIICFNYIYILYIYIYKFLRVYVCIYGYHPHSHHGWGVSDCDPKWQSFHMGFTCRGLQGMSECYLTKITGRDFMG